MARQVHGQAVTDNPWIRPKCARLLVTTVADRARACAVINKSMAPIVEQDELAEIKNR
jgi:hypothetical protein